MLNISSEFLKFIIMLGYIHEDYHGLFFQSLWNRFEKFERCLVDYLPCYYDCLVVMQILRWTHNFDE